MCSERGMRDTAKSKAGKGKIGGEGVLEKRAKKVKKKC
jgi:hypothetical protein